VNVLTSQIRMLGQDLIGGHAISDHRNHRSHGKAQPTDAGAPPITSGSVVIRSYVTPAMLASIRQRLAAKAWPTCGNAS
jgi:hypothetical protein